MLTVLLITVGSLLCRCSTNSRGFEEASVCTWQSRSCYPCSFKQQSLSSCDAEWGDRWYVSADTTRLDQNAEQFYMQIFGSSGNKLCYRPAQPAYKYKKKTRKSRGKCPMSDSWTRNNKQMPPTIPREMNVKLKVNRGLDFKGVPNEHRANSVPFGTFKPLQKKKRVSSHHDWLGGKMPQAASSPQSGVSLTTCAQKTKKNSNFQTIGLLQIFQWVRVRIIKRCLTNAWLQMILCMN